LNLFNIKLKKKSTKLKIDSVNYASKPKHYPPANKEWFNSIYLYNYDIVKLLPVIHKRVHKLVKSYFNLYSRKLENKKIRSRRSRIKMKRQSTNRMLVSKPELKHTNDKVIVNSYVYNRQNKNYINKCRILATIDQIDQSTDNNLKIRKIKIKSLILRSKIHKQKDKVCKTLNFNMLTHKHNNNNYENKFTQRALINKQLVYKEFIVDKELYYLKSYVIKSFHIERLSVYFEKLISFNNSKFEKKYLLPFTNVVEKVLNKKTEFNFVNLKYLYLDSYIFSEALVTKLKNRKNKLLRVLKKSLLMFKIPRMDRLIVYIEMYNRKKVLQNVTINNVNETLLSRVKNEKKINTSFMLESYIYDSKEEPLKEKMSNYYPSDYYSYYMTNIVISDVKNKNVSGIRLEAAGRLTRRYTAARSVFKIKYKGNIRNMDSSYKGLSCIVLRGYEKANLQYTKATSKLRIGSFSLKGWISSSS
jgi:hypothetical protein